MEPRDVGAGLLKIRKTSPTESSTEQTGGADNSSLASSEGLRRRKNHNRQTNRKQGRVKISAQQSTGGGVEVLDDNEIGPAVGVLEHVEPDRTVDLIMKEEEEAERRKNMEKELVTRDDDLEAGRLSVPSMVREKVQEVEFVTISGITDKESGASSSDPLGYRDSRQKPLNKVAISSGRAENRKTKEREEILHPLVKFPPNHSSAVQYSQNPHILVSQVPLGRNGVEAMQWNPFPTYYPRKPHLDKCGKCDRSFISTLNFRRHLKTHKKKLPTDRNWEDLRSELEGFISKLEPQQLLEVFTLRSTSIEGIKGEDVTGNLPLLVMQLQNEIHHGATQTDYYRACKDRLEAGRRLNSLTQPQSPSTMGVEELFHCLTLGSERTFLQGDVSSLSLQRYLFQEAKDDKKFALDQNNIVASVTLFIELKLVRTWLEHKDAEALAKQKALVEEEEEARKRIARMNEKKKMKKQKIKDVKSKQQAVQIGKETGNFSPERKSEEGDGNIVAHKWNEEWEAEIETTAALSNGRISPTSSDEAGEQAPVVPIENDTNSKTENFGKSIQSELTLNGETPSSAIESAVATVKEIDEEPREVKPTLSTNGCSQESNSTVGEEGMVANESAAALDLKGVKRNDSIAISSRELESAHLGKVPKEDSSNCDEREEKVLTVMVGGVQVPLFPPIEKDGKLETESVSESTTVRFVTSNEKLEEQAAQQVLGTSYSGSEFNSYRSFLSKRWDSAIPMATPISMLLGTINGFERTGVQTSREEGNGKVQGKRDDGDLPKKRNGYLHSKSHSSKHMGSGRHDSHDQGGGQNRRNGPQETNGNSTGMKKSSVGEKKTNNSGQVRGNSGNNTSENNGGKQQTRRNPRPFKNRSS